jgi:hypothetical protein
VRARGIKRAKASGKVEGRGWARGESLVMTRRRWGMRERDSEWVFEVGVCAGVGPDWGREGA